MAIIGKKYQKKPTIVIATQLDLVSAGDFGELGILTSGDVILTMADGTMNTITGALLSTGWDLASDNSTLTGSDWN